MAIRYLTRAVLPTTKSLAAIFSQSYSTAASSSGVLSRSSFALRLRPLAAAACVFYPRLLSPAICTRWFATPQTASSTNDQDPNWSKSEPFDGRDFKHWAVFVNLPPEIVTRDQIIDYYIKTLAVIVGSEEEARMKIYSVSTRYYVAFGALVSEETAYKIKAIYNVVFVLPDLYLDVENKVYGGEPFIKGQAVPYDPKYHEVYLRNKARMTRPIDIVKTRNFESMDNRNNGGPQNSC
ncbi:Multiple organellar RNA editing factor 8-chloroplastic/mitochondrial [Striga hermonthica]|uniref:Multiple organellar RNA editing factor 8-chloroplastic/mitochondrial n=1 Tax=Striga hermonthica TaxID=68872 RepID=A0A9N7MY26_STRHE|nr:Multiple organellar RNA editing factor 8-chloroplastic/mitochondrial [Striga hermonthica]